MPIVYVHGVATGASPYYLSRWRAIETYLRSFIAPKIAPHDPERVLITHAYWGDVGVKLAWGGLSRPAHSQLAPVTATNLAPAELFRRVTYFDDLRRDLIDRGRSMLEESLTRIIDTTRVDDMVITFFGDVLNYIHTRGTASKPGTIPGRVLTVLQEAEQNKRARSNEPLIVLSHSMGGQIIYDLLTYFLPSLDERQRVRIDFWCSAVSQIGLFEEMKLFLASDPCHGPGNPVPFPDRRLLGKWWNVWETNDLLSFTVRDIIANVDDEPFDSGLPVTEAHTGCIRLPAFYTAFADKLTVRKNR